MIAAVSMVKDEADIIGHVLCHLFCQGIDFAIVADNNSTDDTRDILDLLAERYPITVVDDPEPGYYQDEKVTRLARMAHAQGATWVVPFDADEVWYSPSGTIAEALASCRTDIAVAHTYAHIPQVGDDWTVPNPILRMGHRMAAHKPHVKVAFRARDDVYVQMGNHDILPSGPRSDVLEIREFQYRSWAQMRRKLRNGKAAYDASTVHAMHGTHWRTLGAMSDETLYAEWESHLHSTGLVFDPAPLSCP